MKNWIKENVDYNAPVIVTFTIMAVLVHIVNCGVPEFTTKFFTVRHTMSWANPLDYFRLVSYTLGHADWKHLMGNITLILMMGPILEEKYGSYRMFMMMFWTALITGLVNIIFFNTWCNGASGIVFMIILLASIVDVKKTKIPLTFLIILVLYPGGELLDSIKNDNVGQGAHLLGGLMGSIFGFVFMKAKRR